MIARATLSWDTRRVRPRALVHLDRIVFVWLFGLCFFGCGPDDSGKKGAAQKIDATHNKYGPDAALYDSPGRSSTADWPGAAKELLKALDEAYLHDTTGREYFAVSLVSVQLVKGVPVGELSGVAEVTASHVRAHGLDAVASFTIGMLNRIVNAERFGILDKSGLSAAVAEAPVPPRCDAQNRLMTFSPVASPRLFTYTGAIGGLTAKDLFAEAKPSGFSVVVSFEGSVEKACEQTQAAGSCSCSGSGAGGAGAGRGGGRGAGVPDGLGSAGVCSVTFTSQMSTTFEIAMGLRSCGQVGPTTVTEAEMASVGPGGVAAIAAVASLMTLLADKLSDYIVGRVSERQNGEYRAEKEFAQGVDSGDSISKIQQDCASASNSKSYCEGYSNRVAELRDEKAKLSAEGEAKLKAEIEKKHEDQRKAEEERHAAEEAERKKAEEAQKQCLDPSVAACKQSQCGPAKEQCKRSQPLPDEVHVSAECAAATQALLGPGTPRVDLQDLWTDPMPNDFGDTSGPCTLSWFSYSVPACQTKIRCGDDTALMPDNKCSCAVRDATRVRMVPKCQMTQRCADGAVMRLDVLGCGCAAGGEGDFVLGRGVGGIAPAGGHRGPPAVFRPGGAPIGEIR